MERISKYQLLAMIILFGIGSSTLFQLGKRAKQDAWLVALAGVVISFLLLLLFLAIQRKEPAKDLTQMFIQYFGSFVGKGLAFLYVLYFSYESMRNVRDFGDLTIMTFLPRTPIFLVMLVMVLLASYAIYKGVEVFFRVTEFLLPGVLLFHLLLIVMYFGSGIVMLDQLLPILENGIMPIIKNAFLDTMWFPFGQMVIFLMFWKYLAQKQVMMKTSIYGYLVIGILLVSSSILYIAILGTVQTSISTIPLLQAVQLIQIANFLERFDAFVILLLYVGLFIKATLWFLAAVLGLGQVLNVSYRKLILPMGGIIYFASFLEPNWVYHIWFGDVIAYRYFANPLFILILPVFLYIVMLIRGRKQTS